MLNHLAPLLKLFGLIDMLCVMGFREIGGSRLAVRRGEIRNLNFRIKRIRDLRVAVVLFV